MLIVETIARIRRDHFKDGKSIKAIARTRGVSRNTVRKVLRRDETAFRYDRQAPTVYPKLGPFQAQLEALLTARLSQSRRERLTLMRMWDLLRDAGYAGSYDAVRRYAQQWRRAQGQGETAYVPLTFEPGEAYQFDWSHEIVVLAGVTTTVKVAHMRLCHSRMPFVRAYPRETQEMVFDAHTRAFAFFRGACGRGIYDNMKTAVDTVFVGKVRQFNRRFAQLCSHYLIEPVACTPGAGWEKGQVENQVGTIRERWFTPRLRFASYAELNAWLLDQCVATARRQPHPDDPTRTVFAVFEAERAALIPYRGPFEGSRLQIGTVSKTCRRAIRPQSLQRDGPGRRPAGRDRGLRRADRDPPGRGDRRRARTPVWTRADQLRSVALRAGAESEAGGAAQRRAVQGLGLAGRGGPRPTQAHPS